MEAQACVHACSWVRQTVEARGPSCHPPCSIPEGIATCKKEAAAAKHRLSQWRDLPVTEVRLGAWLLQGSCACWMIGLPATPPTVRQSLDGNMLVALGAGSQFPRQALYTFICRQPSMLVLRQRSLHGSAWARLSGVAATSLATACRQLLRAGTVPPAPLLPRLPFLLHDGFVTTAWCRISEGHPKGGHQV